MSPGDDADRDRALALAGVLQAATLVERVARQAEPDPALLEATLAPLFRFDAADVPAVYGGAQNLQLGFAALEQALGGPRQAGDELALRYALSLLQFERHYADDAAMQRELRRLLQLIQLQGDPAGIGGPASVEALADAWTRTLGTLRPRVLVGGDPERLRDKRVIGLVRALLLAGFRSAVLWRQVGGSRWSLLLRRGALLRAARQAAAG
jgi:high frequency lysogenization protein